MGDWKKYALVGASCSMITGFLGVMGSAATYRIGYDKGYAESEPVIIWLNYEEHGMEGMCTIKTYEEAECAVDIDDNGSIDSVVINLNTLRVKKATLGNDDCIKKSVRRLTGQ